MSDQPDEDRISERARDLTPEELRVGSDDPLRQAEVILADSDERTEHPEQTRADSGQTP